MANKFIVLVVLVAVAQAALASAPRARSSEVQKAKKASLAAWSRVAETVCKSIKDQSWSIEAAREAYRKNQVDGGRGFRKIAPRGNDPTLRVESAAFSTAFRDAIFRGIVEARKCRNVHTTIATIENLKKQLPYDGLVKYFQKMAGNSGSSTPAAKALKGVYEKMFHEIENLARSVSEGKSHHSCSTRGIIEKIDVTNNIIYSWFQKHE